MADENKLFRKAALEKLSSPEQLDAMMTVTSPLGWLSLVAIGCILAVVVAWSIFGSIAKSVDGKGILIRGAAVRDVVAMSSGRLADLLVKPGQTVEEGETIAKVSQPEIALRIENLKARAVEAEAQHAEQTEVEEANLNLTLRAYDEERASVEKSTLDYERQMDVLREKLVVQQQMVDKGLLTKGTVTGTREALAATEQAIGRNGVRLAQISAEESAQRQRVESQALARQNEVDEMRRQLAELEVDLARGSVVKSPHSGRILELLESPGTLLMPGMRLVVMEAMDAEIQAVLYIPPTEGKKVRPGMAVRVSPTTVKVEEHGFMLAEVSTVSDFPVTPEGLTRVLRNEKLATTLAGEGAPIEVMARLIPDPETPSGFKWSSSKGPPSKVFSGTLCAGSVVVETRKPISYVLPILKGATGLN